MVLKKKAFKNKEISNVIEEEFKEEQKIEEEIETIKEELNLYNIGYPPQFEIDKCVEHLSMYMGKSKSHRQVLKDLLVRMQIQLGYINNSYWIVNVIIFVIAFNVGIKTDFNPYGIVFLISPMPFLLGVMEILKGRENNMIELELSFKISAKEIMLSRIIIMGIFNIILNTTICTMLFKSSMNIELLKINLLWIVPFIWINLVALFIAKKLRSNYVSLSVISVWTICSLVVFSNKYFSEKIMCINTISYVVIAFIGAILLYLLIKSYVEADIEKITCKDGGIIL